MADATTQIQTCPNCGARPRGSETRYCPFCGELMPAAAAARRKLVLLGAALVLAVVLTLVGIRLARGAAARPQTAQRGSALGGLGGDTSVLVTQQVVSMASPAVSRAPATITAPPTLAPVVAYTIPSTESPTETPQPSQTPLAAPASPLRGYVDRPGGIVELRSGPDMAFAPVSGVRNGSTLDIVARTTAGDWLLVRTGEGIGGWAPTLFVHTNSSLLNAPLVQTPPRPTTARPSPTASRTPKPPPPTPRPGPNPRLRSDKESLRGGDCATLRWDVEKVRAVYLDGDPQGGHGALIVCPAANHTYVLTVVLPDGRRVDWPLDIEVLGTGTPPRFLIEHVGCLPHELRLGQVKGRVFDRHGRIIVGARVEILVEGRSGIVPVGRTNQDGWYEFNLRSGQDATFLLLEIDGQSMSFYPDDYAVTVKSGCYQRVDFRQR